MLKLTPPRLALAGALAATLFSGFAIATEKKLSPTQIDGVTTVDVQQAKQLFEAGVLFVDVRKNSDWQAGRIPDALHLELKTQFNAEALQAEVQKNEKLVIYCNGPSCLRSSKASKQANGWGFSQVHFFRDGFPAWKAASLPVE